MKRSIIAIFSFFVFCLTLLSLNVRGQWGNATIESIRAVTTIQGSAFESSLARGRFAQTMALVDDKRADLINGKELIPMPDLGVVNGKAYPLFAPGLAFYSVPAYVLGYTLGNSQLAVFLFVALCASIAACLVVILAKSLGASLSMACFAGLTYVFGTSALPYAITLAQHNITVLFLLTILLAGLHGNKHGWLYVLGWTAYALAIFMDYPNLMLLAPAIVYMSIQAISLHPEGKQAIKIKFQLALAYAAIAFALVSGIHGYYNLQHFGSPITVGPAVYTRAQTVKELETLLTEIPGKPKQARNVATTFFDSSKVANGLYVLLISKGRGVIYFAPVVLLGFLGIMYLLKKEAFRRIAIIMMALIGVNLAVYASFGDPWGGWEFGPRYLIPAFSVLAIGIGVSLTRIRNLVYQLSVLALFAYSVFVNLLGALTTNQLPAEIEAIPLNLPYTYEYNFQRLLEGMNSSIGYRSWFYPHLSPFNYFLATYISIVIVGLGLIIAYQMASFKTTARSHQSKMSVRTRLETFVKKFSRNKATP